MPVIAYPSGQVPQVFRMLLGSATSSAWATMQSWPARVTERDQANRILGMAAEIVVINLYPLASSFSPSRIKSFRANAPSVVAEIRLRASFASCGR
jgi:hypothetical protein